MPAPRSALGTQYGKNANRTSLRGLRVLCAASPCARRARLADRYSPASATTLCCDRSRSVSRRKMRCRIAIAVA